ncbi:MAG: FAD-dependent oxidoreductase [Desulforhabdus sp.]|jgi:protoporphyrinogen oxidase|nr:FAD-dependent oxidoreductase [Desulforhabdus sp.]
MTNNWKLTILGGGMAGLAVAYYATKRQIPLVLYEAANRVGGNTVTLQQGDFLYDSGAHRVHDRDPSVTTEIKTLLGPDLQKINVPSQIYHNGCLIDFPLSPLNLLRNFGLLKFTRAAAEVLRSRLNGREGNQNFEDFAVRTYGREIAESFLLNYSQKLWGVPCSNLSVNIAGKRLRGLDIRTFLVEALFGQKAKTDHLEGSAFYYPKQGIGTIPETIARLCGYEHIELSSRVTRILHDTGRIQEIEINGERRVTVGSHTVVSTLPMNYFLNSMEPKPPEEIARLAEKLKFRNLILVAFFLNKETITHNATTYFPEGAFPLTRFYEPKNRSSNMSPPGKTSVVAEIPCQPEDSIWRANDADLIKMISEHLFRIGWIKKEEILDSAVQRLEYAYPILETSFEERVGKIIDYLSSFENLKLSGRNALFAYSWVHDMMRLGREIVDTLKVPGLEGHNDTHGGLKKVDPLI